jgi:DNA phosphorothioation-dependent restriction protein DptG
MRKFIKDLLNSRQDLPDDLIALIRNVLDRLGASRQTDGMRKIGDLTYQEIEYMEMEMREYEQNIGQEIEDWRDTND